MTEELDFPCMLMMGLFMIFFMVGMFYLIVAYATGNLAMAIGSFISIIMSFFCIREGMD